MTPLLRYADMTDAVLVSVVVDRGGEAYAELLRRHSRSVSAAARMILGNGPETEDVVAEVFVSFWLRPEAFDPARSSLLGYLRMKAKGRSIDVLRAKVSRRRREDQDAFGVALGIGGVASDVESTVLESEAAGQVRAAVSLLPPLEREAVRLAYFGGMTYLAVAQYLSVPEGTVKSRIRAALQRLAANDEVRAHGRSQPEDDRARGGEPARLGAPR